MGKQTALYEQHLRAGAKIVDFAGWDMPLHYGSQIEEHHQVRNDAGMFDVSHMVIVDLRGIEVRNFLRRLLANDVNRLTESGKALYSCILNTQGGVIDDLIVYYLDDRWFRVVINAATRDKDLSWMNDQAAEFEVDITERSGLSMIAVQGPAAREKAGQVLGDARPAAADLAVFFGVESAGFFIARTGYTGEDGYEIMLPNDKAAGLWVQLLEAGIKPVGLGARDTLRLEAGMNLYGQDMDEQTTPLESALGWTIAWQPQQREFIGRSALQLQKEQGVKNKLVGLVLEDRGVLRHHQKVVVAGIGEGLVTSGGYAPTLGRSIAFARVPVETGVQCQVEIRDKLLKASVVRTPFARLGKSCLTVEQI